MTSNIGESNTTEGVTKEKKRKHTLNKENTEPYTTGALIKQKQANKLPYVYISI